MTISFQGKGRGKGFAVKEITSILYDEEVTPKVAARVIALYWFLVSKNLIQAPMGLDKEPYLKQIRELKGQLSTTNSQLSSLRSEVESEREESELSKQVDYIICESLELEGARQQLTVEDGELGLKISSKPLYVEYYLSLLFLELPIKIRSELLKRLDGSENKLFYDMMVRLPTRPTLAARLMDYDNPHTFISQDESGKVVERVLKPNYLSKYPLKSLSFQELKQLVKKAKKDTLAPTLDIPERLLDIFYPVKIKLPLSKYESQ